MTPFAGIEMVEEQLEFANGFRPDLIVARDPFESAIVALKIAKKYNRPTQLHILQDYSTADFYKEVSTTSGGYFCLSLQFLNSIAYEH